MKKYFTLALVSFLLSASALANSINVQVYRSPLNLNYGLVESAVSDSLPWEEAKDPHRIFFSANYTYAQDPLVQINTTNNTRVKTLVDNIHTTELAVGYFVQKDLSLYLQAPLHIISIPNQSKEFNLGDTRLVGKWQLTSYDSPTSFAIVPELVAPTGNTNNYLSDNSWSPGVLLVAEHNFGSFRVAANGGYRYAKNATISEINYKNRIPLGIGASIPFAKKWILNPEVNGFLSPPLNQDQNPSEFYLGLNHHPRKDIALILGGSIGTFEKQGSLNYRFQAALRMYLSAPDKSPEQPVQEPAVAVVKAKPKARMAVGRIEILEAINFEHNSDRLLASAKAILDDVAEVITNNFKSIGKIEVEGHTSLVGSFPYNDVLSQKRANAVVKYLHDVRAIDLSILSPKGYGKHRPKYQPGKATDAELELNRRVEFKVIPKKK
jgi:outer membrane protein OmpA-like peptidoglycan-associated protein